MGISIDKKGINSKIQLMKSRARGFKNIDNFIDMIYLIGSKFDISRMFTHTIL